MNVFKKKSGRVIGSLRFYLYLVRSYIRFLVTGKCLTYPLTLHVQTISACNAHCSFCPYETISKQHDQGKMDIDLFNKISAELKELSGLLAVAFELHNEPLLDGRILRWITDIKSLNTHIVCGIVTNGSLLHKFGTEAIKESNVDFIIVSLNANSKQMFDSMNTGLDYETIMENIHLLISDPQLKPKVALSYVITEQNFHDVQEAVRYWKKQEVRTRELKVSDRAGTLKDFKNIQLKSNYKSGTISYRAWRKVIEIVGNMTGCHLPFFQMNVLFNGDALICCHDWNRTTIVGNVKDSSLAEIWNSAVMNDIRRYMLLKRYEKVDSCKECSLVNQSCNTKREMQE